MLLHRGQSPGEGLLSQSSCRQLAYHTSVRQALPAVPRIRPQIAVVLCYFTYFLGYKMFYFISVLDTGWESSPASSRMNPHQSIAVCSRSNGPLRPRGILYGLQIKIRRGSRGCVTCCTQIPTTEMNRVTGYASWERTGEGWTK